MQSNPALRPSRSYHPRRPSMSFKKMHVEAAASSQQSTENSRNLNARKKLILQCQRMLFGAYRADQYADPDGFMIQLGMVLEQYSDEIVVYVTDPRTGVQRDSVWPPSIAEVVRACNACHAELQRIERFRNWGRNNDRKLESPKGN